VNIATFDPAEAFVWYAMMQVRNCYEGLLQYDLRDFSIKPLLAESWEVDENEGTFKLRKGVKFHDGTEFDAEAVKFNCKRVMAANKNPAACLKDIKDVKVLDKYTVRFETTRNWAFLLDTFASSTIFLIVSPTAVKEHATEDDPWAFKWFHDHTSGTGPYILKEWISNQHTNMVRFAGYWKGWSGIRIPPARPSKLALLSVCGGSF